MRRQKLKPCGVLVFYMFVLLLLLLPGILVCTGYHPSLPPRRPPVYDVVAAVHDRVTTKQKHSIQLCLECRFTKDSRGLGRLGLGRAQPSVDVSWCKRRHRWWLARAHAGVGSPVHRVKSGVVVALFVRCVLLVPRKIFVFLSPRGCVPKRGEHTPTPSRRPLRALTLSNRVAGRGAGKGSAVSVSPHHFSKVSCMFSHREFFANKQVDETRSLP